VKRSSAVVALRPLEPPRRETFTLSNGVTVHVVKRGALPYDRDSLGAFLEACDIVKYAALVPGVDDAAAAIQTAITFVRTTAGAARPDSVTNPDGSSSVLVRATEAANRGAA
jgi:hypothetical protein